MKSSRERSTGPSARLRRALHRALGEWFAAERRPLPWRATRDPYAIWISEAMLQQTRVEAVLPFYRRFLARFPDVASLARAEEEEVLALWSGLGYYSRARSLRAAARTIMAEHGGALPRTRDEWLALSGVGRYTAGAVLSIAFGASEPLVDGNVQRVFARLFAIEAPLGSRALVERAWILAGELVPRAGDGLDPGAWNQALMELGARVCTARSPACPLCPVRRSCRARAGGRTEELPLARARRAPHPVELEILVPRERGRYLVVRRPEGGRMAGLFEFPTRELVPPGTAPRLWPREHPTPAAAEERELGQVQHTITHHRIRARVFAARASTRPLPRAARWCRVEELRALALTGLARKVLALATAEAPR